VWVTNFHCLKLARAVHPRLEAVPGPGSIFSNHHLFVLIAFTNRLYFLLPFQNYHHHYSFFTELIPVVTAM
jgi:hypothetical protein